MLPSLLRIIKHLINPTTLWKPHDVTYLRHKYASKVEGVNFFQIYFVSKHTRFAIDFQECTTLCSLQPKIFGRNYLCMNNRFILFMRLISIIYLSVVFLQTNCFLLVNLCGLDIVQYCTQKKMQETVSVGIYCLFDTLL